MAIRKKTGIKWCVESENGDQCIFGHRGLAGEFAIAQRRMNPRIFAIVRCCKNDLYCHRDVTVCPYCGKLYSPKGEEVDDDGSVY